jgi:hypothetical protein
MICTGNGKEHCCWVKGQVCRYVEEDTVEGRRWACGLLVKYGSWAAVNESAEYAPVGAAWLTVRAPFNWCETYVPNATQCCRVGD